MIDQTVQRFPASIQVRASDAALLEILKKRAVYDDTILNEHEPFFWSARISNTTLDAHYTTMAPSSLKNYARDAKNGVPFQDSHRSDSITRTLGRSLTGEYTPLNENKYAEVNADFYTLRGMDDGIDAFINKLRAGLTESVSVGFAPGKYICSICKRDMLEFDWDNWEDTCFHYPGYTYSIGKGDNAEKVLCTASVEEARLIEVSSVYSGSTPGAMITKAQRMSDAGKLPNDMARKLEERYNVRIIGSNKLYMPSTSTMEHRMEEDEITPIGDATVETVAPTPEPQVEQRSAPVVDPDLNAVREMVTSKGLLKGSLAESVRALIVENERLAPLADDGNTYRTDTMAAAIEEGIRAFGADFHEETYRGMLNSLPLDAIKRMRDDWKIVADKIIPTGRRTADIEAPKDTAKRNPSRYRA